ncbi:MAG: TIGR00730 family Rossman fold protein [Verrucomicrobiota bacterium]
MQKKEGKKGKKGKKPPYGINDPDIERKIDELLNDWGVNADFNRFREMMVTILKFAQDQPPPADVRQFNIALKEMRYANKVFQNYHGIHTVSVFGSARTKPSELIYQMAEKFGRILKNSGCMIITGGGGGIMEAAQAGAGRERSFALNIVLPFEQDANPTIAGDPKLITFKYFFTRKLHFLKNSHAAAYFPGGFGTMDECFEALTLIQTGKAPIMPIVMVDQPGGDYWSKFDEFLRERLLHYGLISPADFNLFKITSNLDEAHDEILNFYKNFHSYRYVRDVCVIRMHRAIPEDVLQQMNKDFTDIVADDLGFEMNHPLPQEINEPEIAHLPRLCFRFNMHGFGRLRQVINRVNEF